MDFETAMDPMTMVSVVNAKRELLSHGFPSYIEGSFNHCHLYAEIEETWIPTMVCQVVDGEVSSSELLQWLGY
jgi:hypothetical protein